MPKQLTREQLDSGVAVILRKAEQLPGPEGTRVSTSELLANITAAIVQLTDLQRLTEAALRRPAILPQLPEEDPQLVNALDRLADIQELTQQALERLAPPAPVVLPKPGPRVVEMTVTERDAWGRIKAIKATVEG